MNQSYLDGNKGHKNAQKSRKITNLDALSEHTAQGHHWLVAGLESVSLTQAVHTSGLDFPLEPESWTVVSDRLTPHCLLMWELWQCLMTGS